MTEKTLEELFGWIEIRYDRVKRGSEFRMKCGCRAIRPIWARTRSEMRLESRAQGCELLHEYYRKDYKVLVDANDYPFILAARKADEACVEITESGS